MQFKLLAIATAALSATHANAQLSGDDIIKNIKEITTLSSDTQKIAVTLSPVTLFTSGPKLVTNFGKIIETVLEDIDSMGSVGDSDLDKGVQSNICDGFRDFVKVHQALLSTVIGKAGILRGTPLTAAVAEILAQLEMGVDKLAFGIIDAVPTCADDAKKDLGALDKTIGEAKGKFSSK